MFSGPSPVGLGSWTEFSARREGKRVSPVGAVAPVGRRVYGVEFGESKRVKTKRGTLDPQVGRRVDLVG